MTFHRPAPCPIRRYVERLVRYAVNPAFSLVPDDEGLRIFSSGIGVMSRNMRLPFVATDRQRRAAIRLLLHLDRRSRAFPVRRVFRFESNIEHYAPALSDAEALDICRPDFGWNDVLIVRFHSDIGLHDRRRAPNPEAARSCRAYDTVRFGRVYGWSYALPCLRTGRRDRLGRPIFIDEAGEFVVDSEAGCPEYPAVCRLERPAY